MIYGRHTKKNILILGIGLSCLVLVGCGKKAVSTDTVDTGAMISGETLTGAQTGNAIFDMSGSTREEITGDIPTGSLLITGASTGTVVATGATPTSGTASSGSITNEVKTLIQERSTKPADDKKLTEDDIDLIQKVIQKVEGMGN